MRELLLEAPDPAQADAGVRYDYTILIDEMDVGRFACESYGIRVTDRNTGESVSVPHITTSIPRIDELGELLLRNQVPPCHLRDVIDDWL